MLEHHVWPVAVLVEGLMFISGWYLLSQEQFSSDCHVFCQLLGRPWNTCCLTLSQGGQIADRPLHRRSQTRYSGLGLLDLIFTSVTQGLENQGIMSPVGSRYGA